uniref:MYND-type domain-containing protein n=1 Tax=Mycena chlorophos TaxID=658473 RepID=A0ABQ0LPY9_MYCCL|nr:predicted protein [Mycena chlorophos]
MSARTTNPPVDHHVDDADDDDDSCFACQKPSGARAHECPRCTIAIYCSAACLKRDKKAHKSACDLMVGLAKIAMAQGTRDVDESGRTGRQIVDDLNELVELHGSMSLNSLCWLALNLSSTPGKARTHFIAISVSRNANPTSPRTLHSLIDVDVFPMTMLKDVDLLDGNGLYNPVKAFREEVKGMIEEYGKDMVFGGALVLLVELSDAEKTIPLRQAILEKCETGGILSHSMPMMCLQKATYETLFSALPHARNKPHWKACLAHALDGYAFCSYKRELSEEELALLGREAARREAGETTTIRR